MAPIGSSPSNRPRPRPSPVWFTLKRLIRARVTTGLLTVLPILLTLWLISVIFQWLREGSLLILRWVAPPLVLQQWGISATDLARDEFASLPTGTRWAITGFAMLLTFALLYSIGVFAANVLGRRLIAFMEGLVDQLPFVKSVYRGVKQILDVFQTNKQSYQRVALVPFPNADARAVAFVTSQFRDANTGEDLLSCFVPTTPNPTGGYVVIYRRRDVIEVDWPIEDSFKFVLSAGILPPGAVNMSGAGSELLPSTDPKQQT